MSEENNLEISLQAYLETKPAPFGMEVYSFGKGLLEKQIVGKDFLNERDEKIGYVKSFDEETGKATIVVTVENAIRYFEKEPGVFSIRGMVETE